MLTKTRLAALGFAAVAMVSGAIARPKGEAPAGRSDLLQRMVDCRAISDNAARLACFDEKVGAFDAAEKKRDVVVVDREQVREARKSLFGLSLPSFKLFDRKDEDKSERHARAVEEDDIKEIDGVIERAVYAGDHWVFTLADGAKWTQTDNNTLPRQPKSGDPIHIKRAAFGSFLANVNKQIAIRVQRVN